MHRLLGGIYTAAVFVAYPFPSAIRSPAYAKQTKSGPDPDPVLSNFLCECLLCFNPSQSLPLRSAAVWPFFGS